MGIHCQCLPGGFAAPREKAMSSLPKNLCLMRHLLMCLGGAAAILLSATAAKAEDAAPQVGVFQDSDFREIETKYIFGSFTRGSSTGIEGERSIEPDTQANFGKRGGRYAATQTELELEYTPNQFVELEFGPTISYYNMRGVPGLDDRNTGSVNGVVATFRSLVIERNPSPFAVTLSIEPEWRSLDETSGAAVSNYELEAKIEADAELIKNRLFFAFNLLYEPETASTNVMPAVWNNETTLGVSSALAFQIIRNVVIGGDVWYLRHYDGITFNSFTGDAVYLGPTFFWKIAPKVLVSASWEAQVAGHELGIASPFDLSDFSRQRARLLFEFEF
jgi:hypothetical protein